MGKRKLTAVLLAAVLVLTAAPWQNVVPVYASSGSYETELAASWELSSQNENGLGQCQNVSFVEVDGVEKKVAKFNGTANNTSFITLSTVPSSPFSSVSASTGLTISLWFNADESTGEWSRLFDFGNSAFSNGPPFIFMTPKMKFSYNSNNSAGLPGEGPELYCDVYEDIDVNYGVWNHAVVSLSATEISLYLNGTRVGGAENDNRRILNTLKQYNSLDLGRSKFSTDPDYVGYMRDVSIYKTALTAEDVVDLYRESGGTGAINTPPPYEAYDMNASKNSDSSIKFPSAPTAYTPDGNKRQWVHDPSLIKGDDGCYYMYSTGLIPGNKDVEIRKSQDMIDWTYEGTAGLLQANSEVSSYINDNLWAPEVYKYGNEYRMYYSCSGVSGGTSCIALATSTSPLGPFEHKGIVVQSTNSDWIAGGVNAIDANIICDTEGKMYMVWGSFFGGIKIAEMNAATGYLKSSDKNSKSTPGTIIAKRPQANDNGACEGPFIFYSEETKYYYLVVSYGNLTNEDRGAGGYSMRIGRSKNVTGPYVDYNGRNMTDVSAGFFEVGYKLATNYKFNGSVGWMAIGGNSVYKEDGKYWCVAHARENGYVNNIYVNIRQLFWTEEGWPLCNPSLYAGETEQKVSVKYVPGKYERIEFSYTKEGQAVTSKTLQLYPDYTASVGSTSGTWSYSGENIVTVTLGTTEEKYKIVPSWDWEKNRATYTITGINTQNGLQRWGKKTAYYDWTGEEPSEPTQKPTATPVNTSAATATPTQTASTVAPYKEYMIYGYDFESEPDPKDGTHIEPMTGSAKKERADLRGTAVIEEDPVRGRVLHITNREGAKSSGYLRLPADVLTTVTNSGYTVSMWTNIGTGTLGHSALFEANASTNGAAGVYPMTRISANLFARINAVSFCDAYRVGEKSEEAEVPFATNEWHHVAYSVSPTGICVYLDGKLVKSEEKDLSACFNAANDYSIQKATWTTIGSGRIFDDEDIRDAMFDNVKIFSTSLSESQIMDLRKSELTEVEPDPTPTAIPTQKPTDTPTQVPTAIPTGTVTQTPTQVPTAIPTGTVTQTPTQVPTAIPTGTVTQTPTQVPTAIPTGTVTQTPTQVPTAIPTGTVTQTPTQVPTAIPTGTVTQTPTQVPTAIPTGTVTQTPTQVPTAIPTGTVTQTPTQVPTAIPTGTVTQTPTQVPTGTVTQTPTQEPTVEPSTSPGGTATGTPIPNQPTPEPQGPSVSIGPSVQTDLGSVAEVSHIITSANTDKGDPKGSVFSVLRLNGKGGKKSVKLSWSKVANADGYIIYGAACGKKMKEISNVPAAKKSITIKKLKQGKYYKYIVVAYKKTGAENRVLTQSKSVHVCTTGGKVKNPVKISVKKKLTMKKGKSKKLKAKLKPAKGVKVHIARFRYESADTSIVTVNKKGKIKTKKKGTGIVYIYSQNGLYAKVKIKIK